MSSFPSTAQWLTMGGDSRIACNARGRNKYGCSPFPEENVLAYGSSTASAISPASFAAAETLRKKLEATAAVEPAAVTYERELDRQRRELIDLCDLKQFDGQQIIFSASGTDLHLFASQMFEGKSTLPLLILRVEATETGRNVPDALAGHHFNDYAALGDKVIPESALEGANLVQLFEIKCRNENGDFRSLEIIDAEVEELVTRAAAAGQSVLLSLIDISKTGLLAPSVACVCDLKRRFPGSVDVLVDACQFRLAPQTLKAYLNHDFLVAVTGSKFFTAPAFCGAFFVPPKMAGRLQSRRLPCGLRSYSAKADWPSNWSARENLNEVANYGLLLRWEAALTEMRAFYQLPEAAVAEFSQAFAKAITSRLADDPFFDPLFLPPLDRHPIVQNHLWDSLPTIFPFLFVQASTGRGRKWLNRDETKKIYETLRENSGSVLAHPLASLCCQVGQPVDCGIRDGIPVSALRVCLSSRLIVEALSARGRGADAVIADALAVLDKAALLVSIF